MALHEQALGATDEWYTPPHVFEALGKPAGECPDGPRYKALGNSWAVPVVSWIGARLAAGLEARTAKTSRKVAGAP